MQRRGDNRTKLVNLQEHKLAGRKARSRIRWKHKGDQVSKEFFRAVRERGSSARITALHDEHGVRVTDRAAVEARALAYYTNQYAAPGPSEQQSNAETTLLGLIPNSFAARFPAEVIDALGRVPDVQELKNALNQMASGKSPGPDGVLTEFYVKFWDLVGSDFAEMISNAIHHGKLPLGMNKGLVVLLPKEGDLEFIQHWRPITLLNTAYKILAKVLQIRLQQILPEVIHEGQSAFLPS